MVRVEKLERLRDSSAVVRRQQVAAGRVDLQTNVLTSSTYRGAAPLTFGTATLKSKLAMGNGLAFEKEALMSVMFGVDACFMMSK